MKAKSFSCLRKGWLSLCCIFASSGGLGEPLPEHPAEPPTEPSPERAAVDLRVRAYHQLQAPYRECVKRKLADAYAQRVQDCLTRKSMDLNACQAEAEKTVNMMASEKNFAAACHALKPSKQDFDALIKKLSNLPEQQ